mmetsp:Transcript_731/g.2465  ORF Transcript_731/g.2465 Transcript_731/m.2465 type:complete len:267 (+) Transcript_731:88-888(+)
MASLNFWTTSRAEGRSVHFAAQQLSDSARSSSLSSRGAIASHSGVLSMRCGGSSPCLTASLAASSSTPSHGRLPVAASMSTLPSAPMSAAARVAGVTGRGGRWKSSRGMYATGPWGSSTSPLRSSDTARMCLRSASLARLRPDTSLTTSTAVGLMSPTPTSRSCMYHMIVARSANSGPASASTSRRESGKAGWRTSLRVHSARSMTIAGWKAAPAHTSSCRPYRWSTYCGQYACTTTWMRASRRISSFSSSVSLTLKSLTAVTLRW